MKSVSTFSLTSIIILIALCTPAYAYLDPGTGSMLLQGLAAAFFGLMFFSRRIIASIKTFFNRSYEDAPDQPAKKPEE